MTIQRRYDLPNCRLVVEGWSSESVGNEPRPVLSMVTNAECHIAGHAQALRGGREFIHDLSQAVSSYAQGVLSNIPRDSASGGVRLDRLGLNRHRIVVPPFDDGVTEAAADLAASGEPQQIDLTTVQLFDLVEAVDQLVADAQTLPDLVLPLSPVSRRSVAPQEPVTQRAVPAALGISGLAAAAIALFFVPPPEFRPTQLERDGAVEEQVDGAAGTPEALEGPDPNAEPEELAPQGDAGDGTAEPDISAAAPPATDDGTDEQPLAPDEDTVDELFASAVPLSDPDQLDALVSELRRTLSESWQGIPETDEELIYRVGTDSEGRIVGFKYVNDPALDYVDETPLLRLTQLPQEGEFSLEPIGQFRVVLRPEGVVEVSPWYGRPPEE